MLVVTPSSVIVEQHQKCVTPIIASHRIFNAGQMLSKQHHGFLTVSHEGISNQLCQTIKGVSSCVSPDTTGTRWGGGNVETFIKKLVKNIAPHGWPHMDGPTWY